MDDFANFHLNLSDAISEEGHAKNHRLGSV